MKVMQKLKTNCVQPKWMIMLDKKRLKKIQKKLLTPSDFDLLAASIAKESHDRISLSTLKRVWGYVNNKHRLRNETLSILARFVGYNDWTDFCKAHSGFVDSDILIDG